MNEYYDYLSAGLTEAVGWLEMTPLLCFLAV